MPFKSEVIQPNNYNGDLPPELLPLSTLSEIKNLEYRDGQYHQALPYQSGFAAPSGPIRYLLPNQTEAEAFWCYATNTNWYANDGTTETDISPLGLTDITAIAAPWTGDVCNQRPVMNSLIDGPYWWDQDVLNDLVALPGWPSGDLCNSMRSFRGYLIAMNCFVSGTRYPDLLKWSDIAPNGSIPTSWTAGITSQAGEVSVAFNPGALVDGRQLLDRFYVYKTSSCYLLQLIGGQFIFSQRPVFASVGALARNCIEEYRGRHIVLTDGDLVEHDGTVVNSLINESQRREIFDNMDGDNYENSFLTLDPGAGRLYIARPKTGETYATEMWQLDLESRVFGKRINAAGISHADHGIVDAGAQSLERTWASKTTQWNNDPTRWNSTDFLRTADFTVLGDYDNSKLQVLGAGSDYDGAAIEAEAIRSGLDFGDQSRRKRVGRVWLNIRGAVGGTFSVCVGAADSADDEPAWSDPQTYTVGTDRYLNFDQFDVQGYYLAYKITCSAQLNWQLIKLRIEAHDAGQF